MKKKLLSMVLVVVMLLTCVPLGGLAVSADRNGNFEYYVENGKVTISSYTGSASKVSIPLKLGGYPVTTIGMYAFSGCENLTQITLGNVKTIEMNAFLSCNKLTSITIPNSVTTIQGGAFAYCENLKSVTIGKGLKAIDNTRTGESSTIFNNCNKLTAITVSKSNPYFCSVDGVLFNKKKTALKICPSGKAGAYTVPDGVTTIENYAFYSCAKLTSITVADSVKTIETAALANCQNLKKVHLGKGVKTIEHKYSGFSEGSALAYNEKLTTLTISKSNPYFTAENNVLFNKKKTKLIFAAPGKTGAYAIPDGVTTIGECAFSACNGLKSVAIPTSVKTVEMSAFGWSLEKVYYTGTKAQANRIEMDMFNETLSNPWHYNTCKKHTYSNACDRTCNKCEWVRGDRHAYKTITKKATATADGYAYKQCTICKKKTSKTTINKASMVKLSKTTYTYNGKVQKPSVTVKDSKGKTISKSNYTVTYAKGRKNVGTYKVTVKFKGNYTGTKTLTFKIIPRAASINKLTAKSKAIVVKVNRSLKQSTGYQIQYSTSSSFKTYKTSWITNYTKSSKTLSGLKAKTTYYVRVRTYKKVGDTFYYSNWSSAKKMKTK